MERRAFLKGVFGGVAAGGIILKASAEEVAEFGKATPEGSGMVSSTISNSPYTPEHGHLVFDHRGNPIGVITEYKCEREMIDVSSWRDGYRGSVTGSSKITATVGMFGNYQIAVGGIHHVK